jgi:hypothetical protein
MKVSSKTFTDMCTPAKIYFIISVIAILMMIVATKYTKIIDVAMIIGKIIMVIFWTFILTLLCSNGYSSLAWFLVLLPFIIFLLAFIFILYSAKKIKDDK